MSNTSKANINDAEGKLESAYGDLTGDLGHHIKGKAKQVEATVMNAEEKLEEGAMAAEKKLSDAADQVADDLS